MRRRLRLLDAGLVALWLIVVGILYFAAYGHAADRVPTPPIERIAVSVTVLDPAQAEEACGQPVLGCAYPWAHRTIIASPFAGDRMIELHEEGHNFDWWYLTDAERAEFTYFFGQGPLSWWGGEDPAGEAFATTYSLCVRKAIIDKEWWYPDGSEQIHGRRLLWACRMIALASSRGPLYSG